MSPWPADFVLNGRYQVMSCLQQREATTTYRALDLHSQQTVIIKCLNLQELQDWQAYQHYEQEVEVLAKLQHPRIPELLSHFELVTDGQRQAVLVLQEINGQTLRERLQAGWKVNEATARDLAEQALAILNHLQNQQPPLVHRDIKPDNLLLDTDNQLYLLDFGAARNSLNPSETVAGTFGYMAPEQALGQQAQPVSDLYALGMTLLELLTRQPPQQLPRKDLHIDFQGLLNVSPTFQHWLEQMLEPDIKRRLFNAQEALNRLMSEQLPELGKSRPLAGTHLHLQPLPDGVLLQIAPRPWQSLLQMPFLKVLLRSLGLAIVKVVVIWCFFIALVIGFDLMGFGIFGIEEAATNSAPSRWLASYLGTFCRLYIFWHVLRQVETPLRPQTLRLQGQYLSYEVAGWLSRRKLKFDLSQVRSLTISANGVTVEDKLLPFLPAQAPLQAWLCNKRIPAPLTDTEQQLLQREFKRHLRQHLPPATAQHLLSNSF